MTVHLYQGEYYIHFMQAFISSRNSLKSSVIIIFPFSFFSGSLYLFNSPVGTADNSPAIYCRVDTRCGISPVGTAEKQFMSKQSVLPSLRD